MTETRIPSNLHQDNLVDKLAKSADQAVEATKTAATAALDTVSDKVESARSTLSPALERALAPLVSVEKYTREHPLTALIAAAGVGVLLGAILRRSR
jgi:ElaB/YqjD/DUF883 family membrane-anchored ribosome-binding protein